jgi:ABC-2 type transport system permease protein
MIALWQIRYEWRAYWRDRRRAVMTFAFPVLMLLLIGSLNEHTHISSRGGIPFLTFFVPGIVAYGVMTTTFSNLAVSLAAAREQGILKRVQGTPLPWWAFLAGRVGAAVAVTATMTAVTVVAAHLLFGVPVRARTLPAFLLSATVGATCFTALGIGVVRWLPSADSAGPMQAAVVFPVAFISNIWFPMDGGPGWLQQLSKWLPLRPLSDALQTAFDPRTAGAGFSGPDLVALAIWTAVGARLMMRFLRAAAARD